MDLQNIWQNQTISNDLPPISRMSDLQLKERKNPLTSIKRRLIASIIWCLAIASCYVAVILYYNIWQVQALISVALLFTVWGGVSSYLQYKKTDDRVFANNLLTELTRYRNSLHSWVKVSNRAAVFVYPFNVCGGFLLGGVLGSGKSVAEFMSKPATLWILIATVLILCPIAYYLGRLLNNIAYGKFIDKLNQAISELSDAD